MLPSFVLIKAHSRNSPPPAHKQPPPTSGLTNEAAVPATSSRTPGLLAAIRAHQGVKALKKAKPVPLSKSESLEDSLKVQLTKRRQAFHGEDLGSLSKLIPEPEAESGSEDDCTVFEGKSKNDIYFFIF